ncbi:SBP (S-ribonuclease binding protein) family protein [Striga asiatica]|uniref:SBP (S-ribonuclease binding protein) family protein n=1 Tax=Striga asiatica TaxID=4170 RepID=A0A5A7Q9A8_STRAF|nr:SBP (S-ribonuclease binding protein) family protein [Striga asiatica]
MAVEATHLNLFPGQLIQDRHSLNPSNQGSNLNIPYNSAMGFVGASLPEYQLLYRPAACNSVQAKTSANTDSGLTCNVPVSRKRQRDSVSHLYGNIFDRLPPSLAAGEDIMPQIQQYQLDIDAIISQHNKKIRLELEERQKQQTRLLAAAVGEGAMRKLREKDEQIQRMGKLNLVLQERVKSLYVENQLWRDLAQTNEAAANSLRNNLEQVLLHIGSEGVSGGGGVPAAGDEEEDVESCCGSSDGGRGREEETVAAGRERMCRMCGEREPCVLLLPCRHLCLCGPCGGGSRQLRECPVCNASMDATLHVNMTSS